MKEKTETKKKDKIEKKNTLFLKEGMIVGGLSGSAYGTTTIKKDISKPVSKFVDG
jgi:hypothetical protein